MKNIIKNHIESQMVEIPGGKIELFVLDYYRYIKQVICN